MYVPLSETLRGFREIIEGKHDDLPESAFLYVGTIDEAVEKALVGELDENGWKAAVETAWETDGKIRSEVWTKQYHAFVDGE